MAENRNMLFLEIWYVSQKNHRAKEKVVILPIKFNLLKNKTTTTKLKIERK